MRQANVTTCTTPPIVVNFITSGSILNFPAVFAYLIGESRLFRRIVTFLITALYKYSYTYLFTDQFLVDKYLRQFYGISKPRGGKIFITRPRMV